MRRFVTLFALLLFAIPFGVSVSGCSKKEAVVFCNGGDSGPSLGQVSTIKLGPITSGISLNYAQISQIEQPTVTDCKGDSASAGAFTYSTTDMTLADVQPSTGRVCGGTWNRNTGGGILDYTICTPATRPGTAYVFASAQGVTSNPVPIFVHPVVTSVVFGTNTSSIQPSAITAYSIAGNTPTFTALNSYTVGQVLSLYGFSSLGSSFNGITNAVVVPYTADITAWSVTSNVPTFTSNNSFAAGQVVTLGNFPTDSAFFNGVTNAVVQSTGLSSTQFTVAIPGFVHANASGTDFGTASGDLSSSQFSVSIPGNQANTSTIYATGYAGPSNCVANATSTTSCYPIASLGTASTQPYDPTTCVSQGQTRQLIARVYAGTGTNQTNISPYVGPLQYQIQSGSSPVVAIDPTGIATADQPGSVEITAYISTAASSAGFFSTCPPKQISLSLAGATGSGPYTINQNTSQSLIATAVDTQNNPITGLNLEYETTAQTTIPTVQTTVTPQFAGAASISAICQPPACNPAPYNEIGALGNGKPVTSNSINVVAPGANSAVLYMASTQSLYMTSRDFTQPALSAALLLPYTPNSMIIDSSGANIYMGSQTALMVINTTGALSVSRVDPTSEGVVLAVSPDRSQIVISDPIKKTITIENPFGTAITTYGGIGTRAAFTPDSQTVYIAAGNQILVYSAFTGWTNIDSTTRPGTQANDVAITVPAVGAYFAGPTTTAIDYCSTSTSGASGNESNIFYPTADTSSATTDRIAATNDGKHILGATITGGPTLNDLLVQIPSNGLYGPGPAASVPCPLNGTLTFSDAVMPTPLAGITASAITGVFPTSDSSEAFITYTGSGGVLPAYAPATSGAGTYKAIPLLPALGASAPIAPISGALSTDNTTFYTGTSGDNLVHIINRATLTDTGTLAPKLINPSGTVVPVDLLVQKPRTQN